MRRILALLIGSLLTLHGGLRAEDEEEKKITRKDVPAVVKKSLRAWIKDNAKGAKIGEIELETEDGKKVYEFELTTKDGTKYEVELDETGKILEAEKDDDDDDDDDEGEDKP